MKIKFLKMINCKTSHLLFFLIIYNFSIYGTGQTPVPYTNNTNSSNISITNNTYYINGLPEMISALKKNYLSANLNLSNYLKKNKLFLALTATGAYYLYINYQLLISKNKLYQQHTWANWKQNNSLQDLIKEPTTNLCQELHQSILNRYNNNNQSDCITPIVLFNTDLNTELNSLKKLIKYFEILKKLKLKKFFIISDQDLELANTKISRLYYLKKIINESVKISIHKIV